MKELLYFAGGVIVGGLAMWLINRRKRKPAVVKTFEVVDEHPDFNERREEPVIEVEPDPEPESDIREKVNEILRREHYIPYSVVDPDGGVDYEDEDKDDEDLEAVVHEMNENLSQYEHPEDDNPKEDIQCLSDDEYFTERHEYTKLKVFLDDNDQALYDALGTDHIQTFDDLGFDYLTLRNAVVASEDGVVYYRIDALGIDFSVYLGGDYG